jgi:hypothetical protein
LQQISAGKTSFPKLITAAFDQPGKKENGIVQMGFRKFKDPE